MCEKRKSLEHCWHFFKGTVICHQVRQQRGQVRAELQPQLGSGRSVPDARLVLEGRAWNGRRRRQGPEARPARLQEVRGKTDRGSGWEKFSFRKNSSLRNRHRSIVLKFIAILVAYVTFSEHQTE